MTLPAEVFKWVISKYNNSNKNNVQFVDRRLASWSHTYATIIMYKKNNTGDTRRIIIMI